MLRQHIYKRRNIWIWAACALALLALGAGGAQAMPQSNPPQASAKSGGASSRSNGSSILGSVTIDGQPLADVPIMVLSTGKGSGIGVSLGDSSRTTTTDEGGRFALENLKPGPYRVFPFWRGYIVASGVLDEDGRRVYYYPGDSATLRMVKGGVITGRVVDNAGVPMVQVPVRAVRLRDPQGRPGVSSVPPLARADSDLLTDDRGIYRIYGLEPGVYVVAAGGGFTAFTEGAYTSDAPTYYPGSVRASATEVTLAQGQELTGIDIAYQNFKGHSITGAVAGTIPSGSLLNAAIVMLAQPGTGTIQGMGIAIEINGARSFAINGVPDGKYNIAAVAGFGSKDMTLAPPRSIEVNGSDLGGVNLVLSPIPRVSGVAAVDTLAPDPKAQCKRGKGLRYCLISSTSSNADNDVFLGLETDGLSFDREALPDENGKFQIQLIGGPGRYHLDITLPDDELYVKSITIPPDSPGRAALDASAGFPVAVGQISNNLAVTLGEGAAGLSGRVVPSAPAAEIPARTAVALIPAEPGSEDDVLRYTQASVRADATFHIRNLPPGRYYVLARRITDQELSLQSLERPWWNREFRTKLHEEGEKTGTAIEFRPCQRTGDYTVRYAPPAPTAKTPPEKQP
jgi:hypothetical protein